MLRTANVLALYAVENRARFRILYDQTFTAPGDASVVQSWVIKLNLKVGGRIGFTTNVATTVNENGLYMLNIAFTAPANPPDIDFAMRLFFTDM